MLLTKLRESVEKDEKAPKMLIDRFTLFLFFSIEWDCICDINFLGSASSTTKSMNVDDTVRIHLMFPFSFCLYLVCFVHYQ